ncbi:uncharacterized protein LOC135491084 [Lineus longissimus]|uniref:uncharacterized protein LOC135491084 n=1 Tax=Lineus longissimus TaxID=88925 RepID=UPI00315D5A9D
MTTYNFNTQNYLQVSGTAIGTKVAPSFANLFMADFEESHVYTHPTTTSLADAELVRALPDLDKDRINGLLSPLGIKWHFNPPAAPHFGGAWEHLVSSVKRALSATLKNTLVTDTVLCTALIEVEAVLNSRPLTQNSPDPHDFSAMTPNHFLLGCADRKIPPVECQDREINSRRRWRQCQVIANRVCSRSKKEYLQTLTVRSRWTKDADSTTVGSLVLLVDEETPRGHWELGCITVTYRGDDGRVHAVDVKTARNTYRRPAAKVCILEENVNNRDDNHDDAA